MNFDGYLVDLDGCVWQGNHVLPGSLEFMAALDQRGKGVVYLTNTSWLTARGLMQKVKALHLPIREEQVLTAVDVVGEHLRRTFGGGVRVLVVAPEAVEAALQAAGHTVVPVDPAAACEAVVVGADPGFSYDKMWAAAAALHRGARLFALAVDRFVPLEGGAFRPGTGSLLAAIRTAVPGETTVEVVGKPARPMFEVALQRLGLPPQRVAMVGDNPATDIAGGRNAGLYTIMVAGHYALRPGDPQPDLSVSDLGEVARRIRGG